MKLTSLSLIALLTSAVVSNTDAAVTGLLDLSGRDVDGLGLGESSGSFTSPKTFSATTDLSLNDIAWTSGAFSGTFDLSLVATAAANINRGGKGAFGVLGGGNTLVDPGEAITLGTLVASDFTGDLTGATNLRFNAVYLGNEPTGLVGVTINAVTVTNAANGGDTLPAMRNDIALATSALVNHGGTGGTFSINGIDVTFDAQVIPEPGAFSLALLGGIALAFRRRRK